jgi:hypothetical protein
MTKEEGKPNGWTKVLRWSARLLGLVTVGLFVAFLIVSGAFVFPALTWSSPQGWPLLIALAVAIVGVIVMWRREFIGSLITLAGVVAVIGLVCWGSGTDMLLCAFMFILPLLIAALLSLGCCVRTRLAGTSQEA